MDTDDEKLLRAKYAEVAALKKAIDERKRVVSGRGYRGYLAHKVPSPHTPIGKPRPVHRHQNLTLVMLNKQNNGDDDNKGEHNAYIHTMTGGGNSVMSVEQYQRTKQIEEARQKEKLQRIQQQRLFYRYQNIVKKNMQDTEGNDRIRINGIVYAVTHRGAKLVLLSVPWPWKEEGSERWNGDTYIRQSNGNLHRLTTDRGRSTADLCRYFASTGICLKGSSCAFLHKDTHLRLCKSVGKHYQCHHQCLLSHTPSQYNLPLCRYLMEGCCSNQKCPYLHPTSFSNGAKSNGGALASWVLVCRPFAYLGVCQRGKLCLFLHLFRCADFEERGMCPRGKLCPLEHVYTRQVQQNVLTGDLEETTLSEGVVVEEQERRSAVSSFTVDPLALFVRPKDSYDVYIDPEPRPEQEDSEFMITLHSDSEDDVDDDDVEHDDSRDIEQSDDQLKENDSFVNI